MVKDVELNDFLDEMSVMDGFSSHAAFKELSRKIPGYEKSNIGKKLMYVGVTAFTAVAAMLVFWLSVFNSVSNTSSDPLLFRLPDGSTIVLNKGAELKYERNFKDNRELRLKGEAFFNVVRDEENPFLINVGSSKVKVLGTSFNVRHNTKSDDVEVYVKSGKVLLENSSRESVKLIASEYGFSNKNVVYTERVNDKNYMAWKSRKLVFENDKLDYVVSTVEKVYHCNINVQDSSINSLRISTTFFDLSVDEIIESISLTLNVEFEKEDDNYIFSLKE